MCSQSALLVLVGVASILSKVTRSGTDECFFVVNVPSKRMVSFGNINWPEKYSSGEICQWVFFCPSQSFCRLRCPDVGLPKTDDCYMDKILVYTKGKTPITTTKRPAKKFGYKHHNSNSNEQPRVYCGRTTINVRSSESKISMVLISHESSPGGRFRCTVTPEKWSQKKLKHFEVEPTNRQTAENSY